MLLKGRFISGKSPENRTPKELPRDFFFPQANPSLLVVLEARKLICCFNLMFCACLDGDFVSCFMMISVVKIIFSMSMLWSHTSIVTCCLLDPTVFEYTQKPCSKAKTCQDSSRLETMPMKEPQDGSKQHRQKPP